MPLLNTQTSKGISRGLPRSEYTHIYIRVTSVVIVLCLSLRAPLRERVGSGDTPGDTHVKNTMLFMLNINMAILIVEPKYTVLQLLIVYYCYDNFVFSCTDHHLHHHLAAVPLGDLPHHLLHPVAERTVGI